MRVVVQRVSRARVSVEGRTVAEIGCGLLALVGFRAGDGEEEITWMADKLIGLRVFADEAGKMNRCAEEVGGELLLVSQFTLYGDVRRGCRPSFVEAAPPAEAKALFARFVDCCRNGPVPVATGSFGARMQVELVNEGPVTLTIDR